MKIIKRIVVAGTWLLYNLKELFHLWFGLKLVLTKRLSSGRNYDPRYDLGYWIMLKFKFITLCQWLFCDHRLFAKMEAKNNKNALKRLKKQVGKGSEEYLPVDVVSPDIDPKEFYKKYVANPQPVVIKGLANDCEAIQKWSREYFLENYGDTEMYMNEIKYGSKIKIKEWLGRLSEVLVNKGVYVDNCKVMFTKHSELKDDIAPVATWSKFLKKSIYLFPQLFLGFTEGAPFHCANQWNFFVMVEGKKQWTFIHPDQSLQVGALINPSAIYSDACVTGKGSTWRDKSELYNKYCPKYRVVVEKGDVLLNPPWWWHEIKNETPFTIAIATRWFVMRYKKSNCLFDFIQLISRQSQHVNYHNLSTEGGAGKGNAEDDDIIRKYTSNRDTPGSKYTRDYQERCNNKLQMINSVKTPEDSHV